MAWRGAWWSHGEERGGGTSTCSTIRYGLPNDQARSNGVFAMLPIIWGAFHVLVSDSTLRGRSTTNPDDKEALGLFLNEQGELVRKVMLLTMQNLAITQKMGLVS